LIKQCLKLFHGWSVDLDQEAILARDAMTFGDLWK